MKIVKTISLNVSDRSNLYSLLFDKEFLLFCYNKIKSNPSNVTKSKNLESLDSISMSFFDDLISSLKSEKFQFKPSERIFIPKKNGKMRPLGVPSPRDKILQTAMALILNTIYEPKFSDLSHGFRPNRSCHSALKQVKSFTGVRWMIEGDIKGYFDNIDHHKLIEILSREIKDQRFIDLIWKAIKIGYINCGKYSPSSLGVPQGGIISPVLSNIYLHEFDKYIENLMNSVNSNPTVKPNPVYRSWDTKISTVQRWEARNLVDRLPAGETFHSLILNYKNCKRMVVSKLPILGAYNLRYVRYADDFLVGVIGSYSNALKVRDLIKDFLLSELKVELNIDKTFVTNIGSSYTKFLGTYIRRRANDNSHLVVLRKDGCKMRTTGLSIQLEAPLGLLVNKLIANRYAYRKDQLIIPRGRADLQAYPLYDIVLRFNSVLSGIFNYYSFAYNKSSMGILIYLLKFSLAKTIARKLRLRSVRKVFRKFGSNLTVINPKTNKSICFKTPKTLCKTPYAFAVSDQNINKDPFKVDMFYTYTQYHLGAPCLICNSMDNVQMHHIKHVRKMGVSLSAFSRQMAKINRKQIPVCRNCHVKIHSGLYDGISLSDL